MSRSPDARFCPRCGTALRRRKAFGTVRPSCSACGYVHYENPKVAVGVLATRRGKLLLVRRNHEPHFGEWSFPSGFVDGGEALEDAAVRETKEETGLEARIGKLIGAFSSSGQPVIFLAYAATITGGRIDVGVECQDVRFFDPVDLPPLAFEHDGAIVKAWRRMASGGRRRSPRSTLSR